MKKNYRRYVKIRRNVGRPTRIHTPKTVYNRNKEKEELREAIERLNEEDSDTDLRNYL